MRKYIKTSLFFLFVFSFTTYAQITSVEKRELRKNTVVKEWNTEGNRRWLDHITVFNENGQRIEDIEYAVYGQKERITYEYDEVGQCIKEVIYDNRNKPYRIRKYEYFENGLKKKQLNYFPNGKLYSTKVFEYTEE